MLNKARARLRYRLTLFLYRFPDTPLIRQYARIVGRL